MSQLQRSAIVFLAAFLMPAIAAAQTLPFTFKIETFQQEDTDVRVFAVRLEQPFLADEFEKSNYLRLKPLDDKAYLIYPSETKFEQKHAEFYGRLRGTGKTRLRLNYEIVSENLDGTRKVDTRSAELEVTIPEQPTGPETLYTEWARQQNTHFADLLKYYPQESLFEYILLQSKDRYGVEPPPLPQIPNSDAQAEENLYYLFSGGLSVQQALQRQTLGKGPNVGDLNIHISTLSPPKLDSRDYESLLKEQAEAGVEVKVSRLAQLVPSDQYFLQFNSMQAANEFTELSVEWGESLLRLFTLNAREHHLREKYETQLCLKRDGFEDLFAKKVIGHFAITGSDFFVSEGTDVTLIVELNDANAFRQQFGEWVQQAQAVHADLIDREFNYRGQKVAVRYTPDRTVSSFAVIDEEFAVVSNSHVAIRKVIDTRLGEQASVAGTLDYQYMTTLLPPADEADTGYLYASQDFLEWLVSPEFKIGEKRRLQSFTNLVMLNNASLFYRLENGSSPETLNDLIEGRFVNPEKIVCPHGGAYAFDAERDTCTSSLYNRIKYLTPINELKILKISRQEQQEYSRYRQRYDSFWKQFSSPVAVRLGAGNPVRIETQVMPLANCSVYSQLAALMNDTPIVLSQRGVAESSLVSMQLAPGREQVAQFLQIIPGMSQALNLDPTLTDLSWLGDQVSLHFCDDDTVFEVDPTRLRTLNVMFNPTIGQQLFAASALSALTLPTYITIDVEDADKAERLLKNLTSRLFLESRDLAGLPTELDGYQLPDYKNHSMYVLSYRLYALKIRLHLAIVDGRLVAATEPHLVHEVIDATENNAIAGNELSGHGRVSLNLQAMEQIRPDVELYWAERARHAAHRNIMPIYNLIKLYDVPIDQVNQLADAKYGVTFFSPDGEYTYDPATDQVSSTVYGNRQNPRQDMKLDETSSFRRFFDRLKRVDATLLFSDQGLKAHVEIHRTAQ